MTDQVRAQVKAMVEQQNRAMAALASEAGKQTRMIEAQRDMITEINAMAGRETVAPVIEMKPELVAQLPEQAQPERPSYFIMHADPDDEDVTICKPVYPSDMN